MTDPPDEITIIKKSLTENDQKQLELQNQRLVSEFKAKQLESNARKHWDLFYKRNETRFFKDRRWTTREFKDLLCIHENDESTIEKKQMNLNPINISDKQFMLEVGCGVGNLIYPLIEEKQNDKFYFYACDFSPRAVEFVQKNPLYNEEYIKAFPCDITTDIIFQHIPKQSLDIVTMVFVLSAIHPDKFNIVFKQLWQLLKPGGVLLFRDYGLYDMAQLRFKAGHKISENLYMRQDGTRSYYFEEEEIRNLVTDAGFIVTSNGYVHRRTINVKENVDVPRIFLQGKYTKPI